MTETWIVSTRHPAPDVELSDPMRKRSFIVCPARFGPKLATVVTKPPEFPLQADLPVIGLEKAVLMVAL